MKTYVQLARAAEIAALGVVISAMAMVARGWELLPEQLTVPMGTAGERLVAIGGKAFLLWLMLAMLAVYLLLSVFMRFHRLEPAAAPQILHQPFKTGIDSAFGVLHLRDTAGEHPGVRGVVRPVVFPDGGLHHGRDGGELFLAGLALQMSETFFRALRL